MKYFNSFDEIPIGTVVYTEYSEGWLIRYMGMDGGMILTGGSIHCTHGSVYARTDVEPTAKWGDPNQFFNKSARIATSEEVVWYEKIIAQGKLLPGDKFVPSKIPKEPIINENYEIY